MASRLPPPFFLPVPGYKSPISFPWPYAIQHGGNWGERPALVMHAMLDCEKPWEQV